MVLLCLLRLARRYYVLRPLRDEMGIQLGPDALGNCFPRCSSAHGGAGSHFGWLTKRFERRQLLPWLFTPSSPPTWWASTACCYSSRAPSRPGWPDVLCLGQRVQSVCHLRVLEFHGRPVQHQAGTTALWLYRSGRHSRCIVWAGAHSFAGQTPGAKRIGARLSQPADVVCGAIWRLRHWQHHPPSARH